MDSLKTFNEKMQNKVHSWKNEVDKIKQKAEAGKDDSSRHQKIKDLTELQKAAYKKLAELHETSGDAWRDLYVETQREWLELEQKMTQVLESFK